MSDQFVHLHNHSSQGSMLDAVSKLPDIFNKVKSLGQTAVALTEHGTQYSTLPAVLEAKKAGIKFIPGIELYMVNDALVKDKSERSSENDVSRKHLVLLAKDNEGYKRLTKIGSWGLTEGFYFRPRCDDHILERFGTEGIIASSACFLPDKDLDVLTKDGIKNLMDVTENDYVLSHTGTWQKVITPTTRNYKGNFYTIKVLGDLALTVTENHKFFIIRSEEHDKAFNLKTNVNANANTNTDQSLSFANTEAFQELPVLVPEEIEAKDIHVNDYTISSIDETIEDVEELDVQFAFKKRSAKHLKSFTLKIEEKFLKLLGIYVTSGSVNSSGITFTFDVNDKKNQKFIEKQMQATFGLNSVVHQSKAKVIYTYTSKELCLIFSSWANTSIPRFIKYLPIKKQISFIQGLLHKVTDEILYATTSKQLLYDVIHILNRLLINPEVKIDKDVYYLHLTDEVTLTNLLEFILHNKKLVINGEHFIWNGVKYLVHPIKSIKSFYGEDQVFCLNVDVDHSFTTCNVIHRNCLAGSIAQYILKNNYEAAKQKALHYQRLFHGDFYLEMQPHLFRQIEVNKGLVRLHKETGIKMILTSDSHYVNAEDKEAHEILLCAQQKTVLTDPNRWKFEDGFYYFTSRQEMIDLFTKYHPEIPTDIVIEAADNTVKIAEQCNVEFVLGKHYLPKIDPYVEINADPKLKNEFTLFESRRLKEIANKNDITVEEAKNRVDSSNEYIRFLTIHGWHGMYRQRLLDARHLSLLMYELDVIISLGFSSYFLILEEAIRWAKDNQIITGNSRGCFSKDVKVRTLNKGLININKIEKSDKVLGFDGKYHSVLQTYEYDCNEDLITIRTENNKIISGATKDHKVLGLKKEDYIEGKEYTIDDLAWYEIDELDENDYLVEII